MKTKLILISIISFVLLSCNSTNEPNNPIDHTSRIIVGKVEIDSLSKTPTLIMDYPNIDTNLLSNDIFELWVEVEDTFENSSINLTIQKKDQYYIYISKSGIEEASHFFNFPGIPRKDLDGTYTFIAYAHNYLTGENTLISIREIDF